MRLLPSTIRCLSLVLLVVAGGCSAPDQAPPAIGRDTPVSAAERGDLPALQALVAAGASPAARDGCHWSPLMKAALNGHLPVVEFLLSLGVGVDARDDGGYTPLLLAASNNHVAVVDRLLAAGADINHQSLDTGWSALIWASKNRHTATVERLLARGADPELRDREGRSALDWAGERQSP